MAGFARPLLCVVLTCRTPSAPRLGLRGGNLGAASQSSWHRFFPAAPSVRVKRDAALPRPPPGDVFLGLEPLRWKERLLPPKQSPSPRRDMEPLVCIWGPVRRLVCLPAPWFTSVLP